MIAEPVTVKRDEIQEALEQGYLFDSAIVKHGFTRYVRDYDMVVSVARGPEYLYRFSHCPLAEITTAVSDDVWRHSWNDKFIDYLRWRESGEPEGYVWGVCYSDVYPGAKYIADSSLLRNGHLD